MQMPTFEWGWRINDAAVARHLLRSMPCAKKRARRRVAKVWARLETQFFVACYGADRFGVIMSGLRGFCMSVEMNGFDRATSKLPDKGKRVVRQAMRLARWAHTRGLWPL